jgi:ribosomal protein S27AE
MFDYPLMKKIDKTSEYYRICPYCSKKFMADHMNRKFCSDSCGDNFNNAKKRFSHLFVNKPNVYLREKGVENFPLNEQGVSRNIIILDAFDIDSENGKYCYLEDLDALGFDFDAFSYRGKLFNVAPEYNCHFLQFGLYRIFLTDVSEILIVITKNTTT